MKGPVKTCRRTSFNCKKIMSGKNAYYLGFQIQPSANKYGLPSVLWLVVTLGEEGTLIGSRVQKELLPRVVFFICLCICHFGCSLYLYFLLVLWVPIVVEAGGINWLGTERTAVKGVSPSGKQIKPGLTSQKVAALLFCSYLSPPST